MIELQYKLQFKKNIMSYAVIKNNRIDTISSIKIKWSKCINIWDYNYNNQYEYKNWKVIIKKQDILKINKDFQNSINQLTAGYSQAEIDSWNKKVEEAKKVIAGETSAFINALVIEWETAEWLSKVILQKADEYSLAYATAEKTKRQALKDLKI